MGYLLGVVSIYVNTWAIARCAFTGHAGSRGKQAGFGRLVWAGTALVLRIYAPVVLMIAAVYALTGSPERTFLNGFAALLCGVRLCSLGAIWMRLVERRACLRIFAAAAWLMAALGGGVVWLFGSLWASAGQYTDGLGQFIAGAGIVLSAPVWLGLYIGVSSLPAMAASLIARTAPPRTFASAASTATAAVASNTNYAFRPANGAQSDPTGETSMPS